MIRPGASHSGVSLSGHVQAQGLVPSKSPALMAPEPAIGSSLFQATNVKGAPVFTDAPFICSTSLGAQVADGALHGPVWLLVICMTISMSPPVGTLPFVVMVTSVFLASIVPAIVMSTV